MSFVLDGGGGGVGWLIRFFFLFGRGVQLRSSRTGKRRNLIKRPSNSRGLSTFMARFYIENRKDVDILFRRHCASNSDEMIQMSQLMSSNFIYIYNIFCNEFSVRVLMNHHKGPTLFYYLYTRIIIRRVHKASLPQMTGIFKVTLLGMANIPQCHCYISCCVRSCMLHVYNRLYYSIRYIYHKC